MARLLIHVEGQTEEEFVNDLLRKHLNLAGYDSISARLMGNSRHRDHRGGKLSWPAVRKDIVNHLTEDQGCTATTMVDYYALPQTGDKAWPGRQEASGLPHARKADTVEKALLHDVCGQMGRDFNPDRFIPFVVMHEFEGLLFSDCEAFSRGIGRPDLAARFVSIREQFSSPEEINDSPTGAPSKRVEALVRGYQKPFFGVLAALEIGLDAILKECPHFREWIGRLKSGMQKDKIR